MNISVLNDSVQVSLDIDTEAAVNAIATNAAMVVYKVVKFTLDRAVEDSLKVYKEVSKVASVVTHKAKRDIDTVFATGQASGAYVEATLNSSYDAAKVAVIDAITSSQETRDAIIAATKVKVAKAFDANFVKPAEELAAQVTVPVKEQIATLENAIADYTRIDEVQAIAEEVQSNPIAVQNEINTALMEEKPQVIDGALISSAGVTNIVVTDAADAAKPKESSSLSELIREEVAKH